MQSKMLVVVISALLAQLFVLPVILSEDSNLPLIEDLPVGVKRKVIDLVYTETKNHYATSFTLAKIPLTVCGIGVDVSFIGDVEFNLACRLEIAGQVIEFDLDDPAVYFEFDFEKFNLSGELDPNGLVKFGVTVDADGFLENLPKLVFYHYSVDFE
jgi:hypothetical protein